MHLLHPFMLLWLALIPAIVFAFRYGDRRRRAALDRFGPPAPIEVDSWRRLSKRICVLAAAVSLILALSRPVLKTRASASPTDTGDVVYMLDVSRSMLSNDVAPTRLARAKSIIASLIRQVHGERTALVVFAGRSSVECPLTIDQTFFQTMLDRASPESTIRGGTLIGDAIQFTLDSVFDNIVRARKQLVIVTDGGDQDSYPAVAARAAQTRGIQLLVIGVGDLKNGALVPTSASDPTPILFRGAPVRTKLEAGLLQAIAAAGAGVYVNGTAQFDAAAIDKLFVASASSVRLRDGERAIAAWLILIAIVLLMAETVLSDRRTRAAVLAVILIANLSAQTSAEWVTRGNEAHKESLWDEALDSYEEATRAKPAIPEAYFNLGVEYYRRKRYTAARDAFDQAAAAASKGTPLEANSKLGATNCAFRQAMDSPPLESQQQLRLVLRSYEELPAIPDAKFNAEVVRRLLTSSLGRQQERDDSPTPFTQKKASTPEDIVQQGSVPGKTKAEIVEKDW